MLKKGYAVAYVNSTTRWCLPEDTERQARFAKFLQKEFKFSKKCVPVGMSCGGMQAIYFASMYPELTNCIYIDAPVVNLLSCPGNAGKGSIPVEAWEEFENGTGITKEELILYRNHPQDHIANLIKNKIPVIMVAGDSDVVVPYDENGIILERMYKESDCDFELHIKKGCDHHPHSLEDNTPVINFIEAHS